MNKRIDYLFKALVLRLLLSIHHAIRLPPEKLDREVRNLIADCEAISDGSMNV